ncbi:MAG TPA: Hsp20/alpha crystallin family protein [Phycisphaerae bacterium]|nr:Hsp20/alpha crystallin family protein [Phycisphaerae bacterium]
MLARRDFNYPVEALDREFGRMLNRLWGGNAEVPSTLAPYAVDVHEDADHFYVDAELPGFTKEDVDVTLEDGVLTIRAERKEKKEETPSAKQPLHVERRWLRFERSFTLPTAVNENSVKAQLDGGILTITLDKREEVKPRKIQISAGAGNGGGQPKIERK